MLNVFYVNLLFGLDRFIEGCLRLPLIFVSNELYIIIADSEENMYLKVIREFVVENFLFGDGELLKEDTSFLERGIIDSTGILELVLFLEETYNMKIEDDELIPENLDNLQNIARFIDSKVGGSTAGEQ